MHRPLLLITLLSTSTLAADPAPRSLDPRLKIELFAEHPQIVTPTGIDVDHKGRVWAIESNTHFRPENYDGHPTDRVLVMTDTDNDRRADNIVVFTDDLTHAMSIAVKPVWLPAVEVEKSKSQKVEESKTNAEQAADSSTLRPFDSSTLEVFLATRDAIWLLHDDNGDLRADRKQRLVQLDTPGDYPHNGLGGFAFDALGWMYFGFGENLGAEYKIIGSDGTTLSGGGEGGNLYHCRPDGSKLSRWATGFWNPHASCVDAFGRLFTVDNDPDSRPPCRLLHVIPGGDYGYRFRNGRKGLHPFTSWNGEIPGTLPMVAGTGEAPSGIVAYESDGLPDDYLGTLLVTSWGDHRIDRFRLEPKGASFTSRAEPIILGGQDFRPVGLALAPGGSLYCTDWVLRDYKLHGKGRVWRISAVEEPQRDVVDVTTITAERTIEELSGTFLNSPRMDVRRLAATALSERPDGEGPLALKYLNVREPKRVRVEALWGAAKFASRFRSEPAEGAAAEPTSDVLRQSHRVAPFVAWDLLDAALFAPRSRAKLSDGQKIRLNLAEQVSSQHAGTPILPSFVFDDPFLFSVEIDSLANLSLDQAGFERLLTEQELPDMRIGAERREFVLPRQRLGSALAARRKFPKSNRLARLCLEADEDAVRRAAVQWVAEENLQDVRPQVEAVLNSEPMTPDLFLATIAGLSMLDGVPPAEFEKQPPADYILPILRDADRPSAIRAIALRLLPPETKPLDAGLMRELLQAESSDLGLEAVRTLQGVSADWAADLLRQVAADDNSPEPLRAEAIVGLASHTDEATRERLLELTRRAPRALRLEAIRALRGSAGDADVREALIDDGRKLQFVGLVTPEVREKADQLALALDGVDAELPWGITNYRSKRPETSEQWIEFLDESGDPEAGRRIFFHPNSAGCSKCHTVHARGGNVGPDLSVIARTMDRKKLAESILEPSKEVSPQFTGWTFVMKSGQVHTGLTVGEGPGDVIHVGTPDGAVVTLKREEIEERLPQTVSIMPDKLEERLTPGEFRDLLAFLETLK